MDLRILHTLFFLYKHSVNLTQPQLCLSLLLFLNNRPIVLSIVLPKNLSLSMLINVMLIKKKECTFKTSFSQRFKLFPSAKTCRKPSRTSFIDCPTYKLLRDRLQKPNTQNVQFYTADQKMESLLTNIDTNTIEYIVNAQAKLVKIVIYLHDHLLLLIDLMVGQFGKKLTEVFRI